MTLVKEIVSGPNLDQLFSALRNRRCEHVVYFTTRLDGVQTREFFFIEGMNCNRQTITPWRIVLVSPLSGEYFVAFYDPATSIGNIALDGDMPIAVLGFTLETYLQLLGAGVTSLNDLLSKTEMEVVKIFVKAELTVEHEMSNEIASRSVCRFEALRDRLDRLGAKFSGERSTTKRLWENL